MSLRRSVFISATTEGFGEWRDIITDILLQQDIDPLVQNYLSPELEHCRLEIEREISRATGVICLVGPYYGSPMGTPRADGRARVSYTQHEWCLAKDYGKPTCVYLVEDSFFTPDAAKRSQQNVRPKPDYPDAIHFDKWQREFWEIVNKDTSTINGHRKKIRTPVELALSLAMINWNDWPRER
jgi:hypothetical protein